MTKQQAAEYILAFLNLEASEARTKRIEWIIQSVLDEEPVRNSIVKYKVVERLKVIHDKSIVRPRNIQVILADLAKVICERHGISIEQLKTDSSENVYKVDSHGITRKRLGKRSPVYVDAREEFVTTIRANYPYIHLKEMQRFLGYRDHSSVIYLLRLRKDRIKIPTYHYCLIQRLVRPLHNHNSDANSFKILSLG